LLTMLAYARYTASPRLRSYLLVVLLFALGLMAKPMLVSLPLVLLLLDYWPLARLGWRPVWEKVPLLVLAAASSVVTLYAQSIGGGLNSLEALPFKLRVANAMTSYFGYIGKTLWPFGLAAIYPHPRDSLPSWQVVASAILLVFLCAIALRFARRIPYLAVGWFWYLITLLPVIGLVQVGVQARADRYTYVPLTGLFIIIAWGLPELLKGWRLGTALLSSLSVLVLAALSITTWMQTQHWQNSLTLYAHTLAVTSDNYRIHFNYGNALSDDRQVGEAIRHYRRALELKPDYMIAHNNLGNALAAEGQASEAIQHYRAALQINPNFAKAHHNLANSLSRRGEYDAAVHHYRLALEVLPNRIKILLNLADTLLLQKDYDQSIEIYRRVLEIKPNHRKAQKKLETAVRLKRENATGVVAE